MKYLGLSVMMFIIWPVFTTSVSQDNGHVINLIVQQSKDTKTGSEVFDGPLRVCKENPRYFTDNSGKVVYLTGSHTWNDFQDFSDNPAQAFDYTGFLKFLKSYNHNFFRLWEWEGGTAWPDRMCTPMAYMRTGAGTALDGKPKYDLTEYNQEYFDRLYRRIKEARDNGMYVGVMLFEGFSIAQKVKKRTGNPWTGHPFNKDNNINGINGDPDGDGNGYEVHTLLIPEITALQDSYVRKVIETVGDFDNIIYEISNESHGAATEWEYHMIELIKETEIDRKYQHPVWMTFQWDGNIGMGTNTALFESDAEAVSPRPFKDEDYQNDPPVSYGKKVVILDTDHLWGIGGNVIWVWKSFTRGYNPLFMDPYYGVSPDGKGVLTPEWDTVRMAMGNTMTYAEKMNMAKMLPTDDSLLCSTGYCLENPGVEYLVFQPGSASFSLKVVKGKYHYEWFNPGMGKLVREGSIKLRKPDHIFTQPWNGPAVLYLVRRY